MKNLPRFIGASCVLALFVGCQSTSTTAARIQEKSTTFAALPTEQQKNVQNGVVEVGYTADMVYVALGHPSKVAVTADGKVGIWTYEHYYPTAAVSSKPLYAAGPGPRAQGRTPRVLSTGPSSAGAHDGGMSSFPSSHGPGESISNRSFTNWSAPDYAPVTLHVLFTRGRVVQLALNGENS